jgi:ABC-type branched-subunit amino acid transport system substrate-binding protein
MHAMPQHTSVGALASAALLLCALPALAQKHYGPGVTDTEIKIGQTMPYSGPLSAYGTIGRAEAAYFAMINERGGINSRKIRLVSLDDAFSPPKTVEQIRKLVEEEQVLLLFQTLGTPTNTAIHKYVNQKKVPHLFLATGATKWGDPRNYPWTMGWQPTYQHEAHIFARYILQSIPNARVAILYQNDDFGRDYLKGLRDTLGDKAGQLIVREVSYEPSDPTVDSQIVALESSGANTLITLAAPKAAAQAIRKVAGLGWKPTHLLTSVSTSVESVLKSAGLESAKGIISVGYVRDPSDPQYKGDKAVEEYFAWIRKYYPEGNPNDALNSYAYSAAQTLVHVLRQCGDDLTRENVMRQAADIRGLELPMLFPGIRIDTGPEDYYPIEQAQMMRFDGQRWVTFGEVVSGH